MVRALKDRQFVYVERNRSVLFRVSKQLNKALPELQLEAIFLKHEGEDYVCDKKKQ